MHLTFHYSIGVILGGILVLFQPISPFLFGLIVFIALVPDIDFLFSKFAPDHNHRMLISHSFLPAAIIIALSAIFWNLTLFFIGLAYLSHVIIDMIDWGNNFLGNGKITGIRILLAKRERDEVPSLLKNESIPKWFFVRRYYHSSFILIGELLGGIGMVLTFIFIVPTYWYFSLGFIILLSLHLLEYFHLKQSSSINK